MECAVGDSLQDVAEMHWRGAVAAEYADIISTLVCGQQCVASPGPRRASRLIPVTSAEPRAVARGLERDSQMAEHGYACSAMGVVL
jgi:hypothetical protein